MVFTHAVGPVHRLAGLKPDGMMLNCPGFAYCGNFRGIESRLVTNSAFSDMQDNLYRLFAFRGLCKHILMQTGNFSRGMLPSKGGGIYYLPP